MINILALALIAIGIGMYMQSRYTEELEKLQDKLFLIEQEVEKSQANNLDVTKIKAILLKD